MLNQSVMQPECSICAGLIGQYCKMPNKWEDLNLGGFYGIVHNIQGTKNPCVVFLWHEVLHARWMEILKAVMHFIFYYTYDSVLPRPRFSDILAKKIQMSHTKSSRGAICHLRPDWERIPN